MATFKATGLDSLITDMAALATLPTSVIDDMLGVGADVLEPALKSSAQSTLSGKYSTGKTAASIKRTKVSNAKSGRKISIYPHGTRNDRSSKRRNAEVGFVNEFGKRGQPARPWMDKARKSNADASNAAMENVFDAFLKSKNL